MTTRNTSPTQRPDRNPPADRNPEGEHEPDELFLMRLRYSERGLVESRRDKPFVLDDPDVVWVVFSGTVDVFMIEMRDGQPHGARQHLWRAQAGDGLFGMDLSNCDTGLLVAGNQNTQLIKVRLSRLQEILSKNQEKEAIHELVEGWILALSKVVVTGLISRDCLTLSPGRDIPLAAGASTGPKRQVLWVQASSPELTFCDRPARGFVAPRGYLPMCKYTWVRATQDLTLTAIETSQYLGMDLNLPDPVDQQWSGLRGFQSLCAEYLSANRHAAAQAEGRRQQEKAEASQGALTRALNAMASILEPSRRLPIPPQGELGNLLAACRLVGEAQGILIRVPSHDEIERQKSDLLNAITRATRISTRTVYLTPRWWQEDHGPLLGRIREGHRPVALLPFQRGYRMIDPRIPVRATGQATPVTPAVSDSLEELATMFYRAFPEQPLSAWEMLRFGLQGGLESVGFMLAMAALVSIIALFAPIATGWLFSLVIPSIDTHLLTFMAVGWLCSALAGAAFQIIGGLAQVRLEGKMELSLEAAQWNRLLALPAAFFRQFSAGDLANRAFSIKYIRRTLTGATLGAILSGLFSVFSLALLFYYDAGLAFMAVGLALLALGVTSGIARYQGRSRRLELEWEGKVGALVLQLLNGITKLRVAGAEEWAFTQWANRFAAQKQVAYQGRLADAFLDVFNAAFSNLTLLLFFVMVARRAEPMPAATFLAFSAAFGQFQAALLSLGLVLTSIQTISLLFERTRPILEAVPEVETSQADPGELSGRIEISHVSYRYAEDGPLILNDLSMSIEPGEFVAIVGPSGSGKSTLFRLLLKFENPLSGLIYYESADQNPKDIAGLNIEAVRRQIGVVLQSGKLIPGTIYSNIVGALPLSLQAAWEAASIAGLSDYIESLPMGMQTVVSEGGGTFSGGQRQRLMIARAVVNRPRILLFDEATSALDNETQSIVSKNLEKLQTTRIVIAHRLSTIAQADHIYVMSKGQIVQSGVYQDLLKKPGPFADLVKRQT